MVGLVDTFKSDTQRKRASKGPASPHLLFFYARRVHPSDEILRLPKLRAIPSEQIQCSAIPAGWGIVVPVSEPAP
jgi:hypothetical protein